MTLPSGVSIGGARAQFHRVRARRRAGWSKTIALWMFTKCPECMALIDGTGEDWRTHQGWHEELAAALRALIEDQDQDQEPGGPVYEDFSDEKGEDNGTE